jgi:poly(A) polymerase
MTAARTRKVMKALDADGGQARFVGGAVRNALIGAPVTDVDIATPLTPQETTRRLQAAGLGVVPTGIAHGTVTAIADGAPYEVTTLRRDVSTDGRRAVVAFTTDWREDASRRDFTMNALYADESGKVFDYFDGIADLRGGRVRFAGDAVRRIREDYLRILRLFRFHAWYGKGEIDAEALQAAVLEKGGLTSLSGERIRKEILRLLEADNPVPAIRTMERHGILGIVVPEAKTEDLESLAAIQRAHAFPAEPLLRLAALLPDADAGERIAKALRFSNAEKDRLIAAMRRKRSIDTRPPRESLYAMGASGFRDAVLLRWAEEPAASREWLEMETLSHRWTPPQFPLDGRDVKALGLTEGPRVGALLNDLEQWWIAQDFKPDRVHLLARLRDLAKEH